MRRLVIWSVGGIFLINIIGISLICINFFNFSKEIERTLLINKSLLVRTEVFEKSLSLIDRLKDGKVEEVKGLVSEINARFSECYTCHHRDDTLSRITAAKNLFERTSIYLGEGKEIDSGNIATLIHGFITYAFRKAKDSASTQTRTLDFYLGEIKNTVAITIGLTLIAFLIFSYYVGRRGVSLEKEIKEKERVITDWALEWQNTFDAMQDMVIVLDEGYKPLISNTAATGFFGMALFSKDEFLKTLNLDPSEISTPVSRTVELKGRILSLRVYPFCEVGKRCIIVLRDITKEMELEEKLKRAEKLASLGIMASGIAHEINNPLSPIIGYSEVLYELERDETKREYIRQITSAASRIENIVKNLLFFAREKSLKVTQNNLDEFIEDVIKTLEGTRPVKDIRIIRDLQYTGPVNIDKGLFEIALLNLLKNAVQAIEESKKGDSIRISSLKENGIVRIEVSDNGPGIPKDLLTRIFDPFFTTKEVGKGTGLGLSITHQIIIAHKGDIKVYSKEGEGTTFTIRIPL